MKHTIVTAKQIAECPTHILSAKHWINVPPGGKCSCLTKSKPREAPQ